jgi:hypothetical protein
MSPRILERLLVRVSVKRFSRNEIAAPARLEHDSGRSKMENRKEQQAAREEKQHSGAGQ